MASSVINSDDGVISGTSGLKSSGGDDGNLVFQSKGTETARINTDKQIVAAAGTASLPALTTTGDLNTGIFFPAADTIAFGEGGAEAMRIDSSGRVGIGTTSPSARVDISSVGTETPTVAAITIRDNTTTDNFSLPPIYFSHSGNRVRASIQAKNDNAFGAKAITFSNYTPSSFDNSAGSLIERARITSGGDFLVGKSTTGLTGTAGVNIEPSGRTFIEVTASLIPFYINRQNDDGGLIEFRQANTAEGNISVSGSTVSYNGGHLSRWAQTTTAKDESLKKGTVLSNLDEMNVYVKPTLYWTEDDELPVDEDGNPTVAVGDLKQETSVSDNEQLNKVKVSDVEGDANVAGVFVNWTYDEAHQVDEINMAMTGDMIIRIAEGVTVARGDLLMSAGDGTAKPQGDDIVRSKTIAKVTSTHVTCTYDDGSYCVPCVLMAC
jgi:hypothetical protein